MKFHAGSFPNGPNGPKHLSQLFRDWLQSLATAAEGWNWCCFFPCGEIAGINGSLLLGYSMVIRFPLQLDMI